MPAWYAPIANSGPLFACVVTTAPWALGRYQVVAIRGLPDAYRAWAKNERKTLPSIHIEHVFARDAGDGRESIALEELRRVRVRRVA